MKYRREIDGLRALAVIPVILFHAGFQILSGGFVGVDIFFVISGYLITSILLAEMQTNTFSIASFYERRARRILPALFFVLIACIPFAWFWLLPDDMKQFCKSTRYVSMFLSNILFYRQSGYFDAAAELKPLLHTWSLGVEEQYYVFFPVVLIALWRWAKRLIPYAFIATILISLVYANYIVDIKPNSAFFLMHSRIWELLIGALAAHYLFNKQHHIQEDNAINQSLSLLGIVLIAYALLVFNKDTPSSSLYMLVPTVGATLIILFSTEKTLVGKTLGSKIFVAIGLISYSAYLWHQPLFAFARLRSLEEPSKLVYGALIVLTLGLAFLSWAYVEKPFRNKKFLSRKQVFIYGGTISLMFFAFGLLGEKNQGYIARNELFKHIENIQTVEDSPCEGATSTGICMLGSNPEPSIAVIGDSHAAALFGAIRDYKSKSPVSVFAFSDGFCAPILGYKLSKLQNTDCQTKLNKAFDQIIKSNSIKHVVLVAEWANYTKGHRSGSVDLIDAALAADDLGTATKPSENKAIFERALIKTIAALHQAGISVIVVEPVPEFDRNVFRAVVKEKMFNSPPYHFPSITTSEYYKRNKEVFEVFQKLHAVQFIKTKDLFCSDAQCNSVSKEGTILFSDSNHVDEFGAQMITKELMSQINL